MPLDHLLVSGCDAVIACLLATSPAASPTASVAAAGRSSSQDPPITRAPSPSSSMRKWVGTGNKACDELCIGDLESCFAGSVCTSLVADQRGMRAFDLTRMHRLVAKFRALIADACYGTVLGDNYSAADTRGGTREHMLRDEIEETPRDDDDNDEAAAERDVPLTPHEELIYRKARRHMTDTVMDLHQRLYTSEILLAEKHQEVVQCYQRMADRAKEFQALHTQLTKLRQVFLCTRRIWLGTQCVGRAKSVTDAEVRQAGINTYVYVYMYMYLNVYIYTCICMCVYIYVYTYKCIFLYM